MEVAVWLIAGLIVLFSWMFAPLIWNQDCGNSIAMFFVNTAITFLFIGAMMFRVSQFIYRALGDRWRDD